MSATNSLRLSKSPLKVASLNLSEAIFFCIRLSGPGIFHMRAWKNKGPGKTVAESHERLMFFLHLQVWV